METWKLTELETIAERIVDYAKEEKEGAFSYNDRNIYIECDYTADYTDVKYYPDSGYEGGDLCSVELDNIDGCWYDAEGSEFDLTEEEKQALQDAVNELIY